MKKLTVKIGTRTREILVLVVLCVFSLRVLSWFQYPNILLSGDFRPPVVSEAFVKRVLYAWDETDFGVPSAYQPRILDPFYFFVTVLNFLGLEIFYAQIIAAFLVYFLSSVLMYFFVKSLTGGQTIVALISSLYLTSNLYLINDREMTAIGFLTMALMMLPSLLFLTEGLRKKSYLMTAISGSFFILTFGTFPNYRIALVCFLTTILVLIFFFLRNGMTIETKQNHRWLPSISLNRDHTKTYLKHFVLFMIAALVATSGIVAVIVTNLDILYAAYAEASSTTFVPFNFPQDVPRLIAKWSFYKDAGIPISGGPFLYVPYRDMYLYDPWMIAASYLPPLLAFSSLLISKRRRMSTFFGVVATTSLLLIILTPLLGESTELFSSIPFLAAFRESTSWIFFTVLSYGILIGITVSYLCNRVKGKIFQIMCITLCILLLLFTSAPLITGDIASNWLEPEEKGSLLPSSYLELDNLLPHDGWTLLAPQRGTYVIYNFTSGKDLLGCGNPYPFIFSNPIVTGAGTEYIQSDRELITEIWSALENETVTTSHFLGLMGIKNILVEKNLIWSSTDSDSDLGEKAIEISNQIREDGNFSLLKETDEFELFENGRSLTSVYVADKTYSYSSIEDLPRISSTIDWEILSYSAFVEETKEISEELPLVAPQDLKWKKISPIRYEAEMVSAGPFILVMLEGYDAHWIMYLNGEPVSQDNHFRANAYANAWFVEKPGELKVTLQYESQEILVKSVIASLILQAGLITYIATRKRHCVSGSTQVAFQSEKTISDESC